MRNDDKTQFDQLIEKYLLNELSQWAHSYHHTSRCALCLKKTCNTDSSVGDFHHLYESQIQSNIDTSSSRRHTPRHHSCKTTPLTTPMVVASDSHVHLEMKTLPLKRGLPGMKVRLSSAAAVVGARTVPEEPHKSHYSGGPCTQGTAVLILSARNSLLRRQPWP